MRNVNLTGRWASDFVEKTFGDKTLVEGRIAVQQKKDEAYFLDVKVWGKTGEIAMEYCKKGDFAIVSGRLEQESWTKDGEKRSKFVVVADSIDLPPRSGEKSETASSSGKADKPSSSKGKKTEEEDDDLF